MAVKRIAVANLEAITEVENSISIYLNHYVKQEMKNVKAQLSSHQSQERLDYNTSARGLMASMADGMQVSPVDTTESYLRIAGKWNSKTTDQYIEMCRKGLTSHKDMMHDIALLTVEWRKAIVGSIGQKRYDEVSKKIGQDLARAYMEHRVEQTLMNTVIDEEMPKSTAEYILKKGMTESLLGMATSTKQTKLERQVSEEAEKRYRANGWEWAAAKAVSFGTDVLSTGGCGTWGNLAKMAGVEVVMAGMEKYVGSKPKAQQYTVERCISSGLFDTDIDVLSHIQRKSLHIKSDESTNIQRLNSTLRRPILFETETFRKSLLPPPLLSSQSWKPFEFESYTKFQSKDDTIQKSKKKAQSQSSSDTVSRKEKTEKTPKEEAPKYADSDKRSNIQTETSNSVTEATAEVDTDSRQNDDIIRQQQEANQEGWSQLMGQLGLSGLGDIGNNLGYVIAMLPDILIGLLTGKTQSLHLRDNLVPIASVVTGLFVKNPILKTLLIGMGGMNLLNKVGHESLERHNNPDGPRFRQYQDEPLNPRITEPIVNGNCMVMNIDRMPCTVTLPDNVMEAYNTGALPLNTMANAILAKHDSASQMAQDNYRSVMQDSNIQNNRHIR